MKKIICLALLPFLVATLSSCGILKGIESMNKKRFAFTEPNIDFHVYMDAINDGESHKDKKYIILPGLKNVSPSNLHFKEYSNYVHRAMKIAGYKKAETNNEAAIAITFAYGIGEPEKETSYTTTSVSSVAPGYYSYTGVGVSSTKAKTKISYTRNIILDAYDYSAFKKTGEENQMWFVQATSTGFIGDLREVLPVMVTAIAPHIGTNSNKKIKLVIKTPSVELYEILNKPLPPYR